MCRLHKVVLLNLPDVLRDYVIYRTDGYGGNAASAVGSHKTTFSLDLSVLDTDNYEVGRLPDGLEAEFTWKIVNRVMELPKDLGNWDIFDGSVHDIMDLLGYTDLGENWSNYFEVKVEYKGSQHLSFVDYIGSELEITDYSDYKLYFAGQYRITIKIKESVKANVSWKTDGETEAAEEQVIIINCDPLDVDVDGWNGEYQNATVNFTDPDSLP